MAEDAPVAAVVDLQSVRMESNVPAALVSMEREYRLETSMDANYTQSAGANDVVVVEQSPILNVLKLPVLSSHSSSDSEDEQRQGLSVSASPPPNCAICLGRCKNKCLTDSCMHQFCFKCLCEWSKVKPECPLCKQTFKSIIHNVKSLDQFEEYHVQPPTVQIPHRPIELNYRQLPYLVDGVVLNGTRSDVEISLSAGWTGPLTAHRIVRPGRNPFHASFPAGAVDVEFVASGSNNSTNVQNMFINRGELLDMYRQEFPGAIAGVGTLSQLWRRYVYDRKLYALPVCDITGRFRESTARFYRENPAQIHRLMAWINRDIVCLLRNTEHDVSMVMDVINDSLSMLNILSPAFRRRMQIYLGTKTSHFIHELNNFARSPYDMIGYDRAVQYAPQSTEEIVIEFSSSSSSDEENLNINTTAQGGLSSLPVAVIEPMRSSDITTAADNQHHPHRSHEYRVQRRVGANATSTQNQSSSMSHVVSFTISTTSDGDETSGVTVEFSERGRATQSTAINLSTHNRSSDVIDLDDDVLNAENLALSSTTENTITEAPPSTQTNRRGAISHENTNIEVTSGSSDECEFVLERKPPHLRTPEMVFLNSESDSDVVFVEEIKPLNKTSFSSTDSADDSHKSHTRKESVNTRRANVKHEQEAYNVGPSTSAGLRSTGRKRRQKSLDADKNTLRRQQRRKCSQRSSLGSITKKKEHRRQNCSRNSQMQSSSMFSSTTTTESESDSDIDYTSSRRNVKSRKSRPQTRRATTKPRKACKRTSSSLAKQNRRTQKRRKPNENLDGPFTTTTTELSEFSSADDDGLSLIALKRLLAEQKEQTQQLIAENLTVIPHVTADDAESDANEFSPQRQSEERDESVKDENKELNLATVSSKINTATKRSRQKSNSSSNSSFEGSVRKRSYHSNNTSNTDSSNNDSSNINNITNNNTNNNSNHNNTSDNTNNNNTSDNTNNNNNTNIANDNNSYNIVIRLGDNQKLEEIGNPLELSTLSFTSTSFDSPTSVSTASTTSTSSSSSISSSTSSSSSSFLSEINLMTNLFQSSASSATSSPNPPLIHDETEIDVLEETSRQTDRQELLLNLRRPEAGEHWQVSDQHF